jgi:transcriptional regulator with XRE-family HTH domain
LLLNIEAERVRAGLNKRQISDSLGITDTTYRKYISEVNPIPSSVLISMANMFSCSIDYLLQQSVEN